MYTNQKQTHNNKCSSNGPSLRLHRTPKLGTVGSPALSKTTVAMHNSFTFQSPSLVFHNQDRAFGMTGPLSAQSPRLTVFCPGASYPGICYLGAVARCCVTPREFPRSFLPIRARADATVCNQPHHSLPSSGPSALEKSSKQLHPCSWLPTGLFFFF